MRPNLPVPGLKATEQSPCRRLGHASAVPHKRDLLILCARIGFNP
jgi:hypothetical protein